MLRKFYIDFLLQNFTSQGNLQGTVEEWDEVLQSYDDARLLLLQRLRMSSHEITQCIKSKEEYYENDQGSTSACE